MGCGASIESQQSLKPYQDVTPFHNLYKSLEKRKILSRRLAEGLKTMEKLQEDFKKNAKAEMPKFYKKFSNSQRTSSSLYIIESNQHDNNPQYHLTLKQINFGGLIQDIFTKNDTINWVNVKAQIKNKNDIKALKIVFKHLIEKIIEDHLQAVHTNRMTIKQCKLSVGELMLKNAIQALIFVMNYPNQQKKKPIYNTENQGFILTLKFLPQLKEFYRNLSIFLKTKYPRSQNIDAGQLGRKFEEFDCTDLFEYDMIAQANILFKTSKELELLKQKKKVEQQKNAENNHLEDSKLKIKSNLETQQEQDQNDEEQPNQIEENLSLNKDEDQIGNLSQHQDQIQDQSDDQDQDSQQEEYDEEQKQYYDQDLNHNYKFKEKTYSDDFQIVNTIKILFNKIMEETDFYYKQFQDFVKNIAKVSQNKNDLRTYQYKVSRKISDNTDKFKQLDTGTIQLRSPQISRVLIKWMEDLERSVLEPDIMFPVQSLQSSDKIQIKKISHKNMSSYSCLQEINKSKKQRQMYLEESFPSVQKNNHSQIGLQSHINQISNKDELIQQIIRKDKQSDTIYEKCGKNQFQEIHEELISKIKKKVDQKIKRKFTKQQVQTKMNELGFKTTQFSQKQKIEAYKKLLKTNYYEEYQHYLDQFSVELIRILIEGNSNRKQVSRQEMQMIKYAFSVDSLINWTIEERIIKAISILIQAAEQVKLTDNHILNLIKFKVNDLMRCQFFGNRQTLTNIFQKIINSQSIGTDKQIQIVKIKNRFHTRMSDAVIYLKFKDSFLICQCQLILVEDKDDEDHKKMKTTEVFNHFLYELQRSPFGVLGQLSMFLKKNSETVSEYYDKIQLKLRKQKKQEIQDCIKKKYKLIPSYDKDNKQSFQKLVFRLQDDYRKIKQTKKQMIDIKQNQKSIPKQYVMLKANEKNFQFLQNRNQVNKIMEKIVSRLRKPFLCSYCFQYMKKFSCQRIHVCYECGINVCEMCIQQILNKQRINLKEISTYQNQVTAKNQEQNKEQENEVNQKEETQQIDQKYLMPEETKQNLYYHLIASIHFHRKKQKYFQFNCKQKDGFLLQEIFKLIPRDEWIESKRKNKSDILVKADKIMSYFNKTQARAITKGWEIYFSVYSRIGGKTKFSLFKYNFYEGRIENVYNKIEKYLKHEFIQLHPSSILFQFTTLYRINIQESFKSEQNIFNVKQKIRSMIFIFDYQTKFIKNLKSLQGQLDLDQKNIQQKHSQAPLENKTNEQNPQVKQQHHEDKILYYWVKKKVKNINPDNQQVSSIYILTDIDKAEANFPQQFVQTELRKLPSIQNRKKHIELSDRGIQQYHIQFLTNLKGQIEKKRIMLSLIKQKSKNSQHHNKQEKSDQPKLKFRSNENSQQNTPEKMLLRLQWIQNIKILNLSKNYLKSIDIIFEVCVMLEHFDASQNEIEKVSIKNQYSKIEFLNLSSNQIYEITIQGSISNLRSINLSFNLFDKSQKQNLFRILSIIKLKEIFLDGINLSDDQFENLIFSETHSSKPLFNNFVENKPISQTIKQSLQKLSLNMNRLKRLPTLQKLKMFKKLKEVYIGFNEINEKDEIKYTMSLQKKKSKIKFLAPNLTKIEQQQFYKHYINYFQKYNKHSQNPKIKEQQHGHQSKRQEQNKKSKRWKEQVKPQQTQKSSKDEKQIQKKNKIKHVRYLYINHMCGSQQDAQKRYGQCEKYFRKNNYPHDKTQYFLTHSTINCDIDEFLKFDWSHLSILVLYRCGLGAEDWKVLVNNAYRFPNLKSLDLEDNAIQNVTKSDLERFEGLLYSYWYYSTQPFKIDILTSSDKKQLSAYNEFYKKNNLYTKLAIEDEIVYNKINQIWDQQEEARIDTPMIYEAIESKNIYMKKFKQQGMRVCLRNDHPMRYMNAKYTVDSDGSQCDFCGNPVIQNSNVYWNCTKCDFDLCHQCGGYQKDVCVYGHPLTPFKSNWYTVRCDICYANEVTSGWHCDCDFDICDKCYNAT